MRFRESDNEQGYKHGTERGGKGKETHREREIEERKRGAELRQAEALRKVSVFAQTNWIIRLRVCTQRTGEQTEDAPSIKSKRDGERMSGKRARLRRRLCQFCKAAKGTSFKGVMGALRGVWIRFQKAVLLASNLIYVVFACQLANMFGVARKRPRI